MTNIQEESAELSQRSLLVPIELHVVLSVVLPVVLPVVGRGWNSSWNTFVVGQTLLHLYGALSKQLVRGVTRGHLLSCQLHFYEHSVHVLIAGCFGKAVLAQGT